MDYPHLKNLIIYTDMEAHKLLEFAKKMHSMGFRIIRKSTSQIKNYSNEKDKD